MPLKAQTEHFPLDSDDPSSPSVPPLPLFHSLRFNVQIYFKSSKMASLSLALELGKEQSVSTCLLFPKLGSLPANQSHCLSPYYLLLLNILFVQTYVCLWGLKYSGGGVVWFVCLPSLECKQWLLCCRLLRSQTLGQYLTWVLQLLFLVIAEIVCKHWLCAQDSDSLTDGVLLGLGF